MVEQAIVRASSGANPPPNAVSLRVALLEAQNRRGDLEAYLQPLAKTANGMDLLARIEEVSTRQGFDNVREVVLQRRVEITTDPVDRMRLRLELARFEENRPNINASTRVVQQLYTENPQILGIVRATTDYFWRNKMGKQAVDTLERAAG